MLQPEISLPSGKRTGLENLAHIFVLNGFALAQPLFEVMGAHPDFLVAHDSQSPDLLLLCVLLTAGIPLVASLSIWMLGSVQRTAQRWGQLSVITFLVALFALQVPDRLAGAQASWFIWSFVSIVSLAFVVSYARDGISRNFLTILSPAILVFPLVFLVELSTRGFLFPEAAPQLVPGKAPSAPVVVVILDELPLASLLDDSNGIDPIRYPNLAELARRSYWFRNALTVATSTSLSVPSILTGRAAEKESLPRVSDHPLNLFTWLGSSGYEMKVFETHTRLCPRELRTRIDRFPERFHRLVADLGVVYLHRLALPGWESKLPSIDGTWKNFTNGTNSPVRRESPSRNHPRRRNDQSSIFNRFLDSIDTANSSRKTKTLHFLHLMLPHVPWKFLPSGREYGPIGGQVFPHGVKKERWRDNEWEVIQGYQRHLLQVGHVDRLIGRLTRKLEQSGLFEKALVVLVADHGVAFRAGEPRREITATHFSDILNVPLIIKTPGQIRGAVVDSKVETTDILFSIAEGLGVPSPWPGSGHSVLPRRTKGVELDRLAQGVGSANLGNSRDELVALRADRQASVTKKLQIFGTGSTSNGLFRIGKNGAMLGLRVPEYKVVISERLVRVDLDQAWFFDRVEKDSRFIPAHITGQIVLRQSSSRSMELAVAVNGTIQATTETYDHNGTLARFTAMVSEDSFVSGPNTVEILEILSPEKLLRAATSVAISSFELVRLSSGEKLRTPQGEMVSISVEKPRGVARVKTKPMGSLLNGWASRRSLEVGGSLLMFLDDELVFAQGDFFEPSPEKGLRSHFKLRLPDSLATDESELRVFAVFGSVARELRVVQ